MGLHSFLITLQPAPFAEPESDPAVIKRRYLYWRRRIFYSIYFGYVVFYFTRKSFTFAMPHMAEDLGLSMAELGLLGSLLYITYGFSKFAGGLLSDQSNPRYFMAYGLAATGILNIFFGASSSFLLLALFWGFNGFFQGWGWPPCTKQLTNWFCAEERGFYWSLKSTSHNVGGALIPLLTAYVCSVMGWRWALFLPGIFAIAVGFWLINRLRDTPESIGLPSAEEFSRKSRGLVASPAPVLTKEPPILKMSEIIREHILPNKVLWLIAAANFFVYVVRTAFNDWSTIYLVREKGYSHLVAASSVTWFEIGGFLGILAAGWASDRWFSGRRSPPMLIAVTLLVGAIFFLWSVPAGYGFLDHFLMGAIGFLIFVPQVLIGLLAAEIVSKNAACSANGFTGWLAYIGASVTGYPLGLIIDHWSWSGFFLFLLLCSAAIFFLLLPILDKGRLDLSLKSSDEDGLPLES